jgi:hypothetical protein
MISRHAIIEGGRPMSLNIRRVVTGHDKNGRAIVSIDESVKNAAQTRPGAEAAVIWTSEDFPVDNDGSADTCLVAGAKRQGLARTQRPQGNPRSCFLDGWMK